MIGSRVLVGALIVVALACVCHAQTVVSVNAGEVLRESDLASGVFNGQVFELGPETIFEINSGGVIGPVGDGAAVPHAVFDFAGSEVQINDGGVFSSTTAAMASAVRNAGIQVNAGGNIGASFSAYDSAVVVLGGEIGQRFSAFDTTVSVVSGSVGARSMASGSTIDVVGGDIGSLFDVLEGSSLTVSGGQTGFALDVGANCSAVITGGIIDELQSFPTSVIDIVGGVVDECSALGGSRVDMRGGTLGLLVAGNGSQVNISDGVIGNVIADVLSSVNVSGGEITGDLQSAGGGMVTLSGGVIGGGYRIGEGVTANLNVRSLAINGEPITLSPDQPTLIPDRAGALLSATLADGSFFDAELHGTPNGAQDFVYLSADLMATLDVACSCEFGGDPATIDTADLLAYLVLWFAMDPRADLNGGGVQSADLLEFVHCWFRASDGTACP